ncbi:MAG: hypothetical protein KIT11_00230 [Fimbriimonadaceae bacterium]|nr:hypothetical protein [Fimbriimonadaceae bacterium]QYK55199.1 MAG: hypothetical protein KF733_09305 [Fimbriimonadaceae bacterium]
MRILIPTVAVLLAAVGCAPTEGDMATGTDPTRANTPATTSGTTTDQGQLTNYSGLLRGTGTLSRGTNSQNLEVAEVRMENDNTLRLAFWGPMLGQTTFSGRWGQANSQEIPIKIDTGGGQAAVMDATGTVTLGVDGRPDTITISANNASADVMTLRFVADDNTGYTDMTGGTSSMGAPNGTGTGTGTGTNTPGSSTAGSPTENYPSTGR